MRQGFPRDLGGTLHVDDHVLPRAQLRHIGQAHVTVHKAIAVQRLSGVAAGHGQRMKVL